MTQRITYRTGSMRASLGWFVALAFVLPLLASCGVTRTETDYFTITDRDTTSQHVRPNSPGSNEDNGIVFPSTRVTDIHRDLLQHDSTYDRRYPDFLRAGGLEFAGLIAPSPNNGLGFGLFGVYSLFDFSDIGRKLNPLLNPKLGAAPDTNGSALFKGELIRVSPMEYRLRWFQDAPGWSVGWSPIEIIANDEANAFTSVLGNVYLRKRIFLRDRIPYLIFSPYAGLGVLPSAYINVGTELTFGSIGGLSLRAYLGGAAGTKDMSNVRLTGFPYFGLGIGVMNFINRPEETDREWKDYIHSAINVNTFEFTLMSSRISDSNIFSNNSLPFNGMQMKLGNASIPLPLADGHFWAGTSLFDFMMPGFTHIGIGVLPLRVGYRQYVMAEDLMIEPFFEYSYYPSLFYNAAVRIKLDTRTSENFGITLGYTSGSPGAIAPTALNTAGAENVLDWSMGYIGVSIYLGDWNHTPEAVAAMRATEH